MMSGSNSRVACESLVTTDFILVAGEITSTQEVDYADVARRVVREIGYGYRRFKDLAVERLPANDR